MLKRDRSVFYLFPLPSLGMIVFFTFVCYVSIWCFLNVFVSFIYGFMSSFIFFLCLKWNSETLCLQLYLFPLPVAFWTLLFNVLVIYSSHFSVLEATDRVYFHFLFMLIGKYFGQIEFLEQFVWFIPQWISSVKTIGFLVEQCQMALWVFLKAYWVWLVFAIQLLLKKINVSFFSVFLLKLLTMHRGHMEGLGEGWENILGVWVKRHKSSLALLLTIR